MRDLSERVSEPWHIDVMRVVCTHHHNLRQWRTTDRLKHLHVKGTILPRHASGDTRPSSIGGLPLGCVVDQEGILFAVAGGFQHLKASRGPVRRIHKFNDIREINLHVP